MKTIIVIALAGVVSLSQKGLGEAGIQVANARFPTLSTTIKPPGRGPRVIRAIMLPEMRSTLTDMDAFALAIAPTLRAYTDKTDFEACCAICRAADGALMVAPLTIKSHGNCPITNWCPKGGASTGVHMHTHASKSTYTINRVDSLFERFASAGMKLDRENPDALSDEDLASGEGYVVSPSSVWHHDGHGGVRLLSAASRELRPRSH